MALSGSSPVGSRLITANPGDLGPNQGGDWQGQVRAAPLRAMRRLPSHGNGCEGCEPSASISAGKLRFFYNETVKSWGSSWILAAVSSGDSNSVWGVQWR